MDKQEEDECFSYAIQLLTAATMPMVLNAIVRLDVLEIIAKAGPVLTSSVVDGGAGAQYQRRYGLAPVANYFIKQQYGAPLRPLLVYLQDKVLMESWYQLGAAILEGGTAFERTHASEIFTYIGKDPKFNEAFNNAMSSHTRAVLENVLECYKGFENVKTLVDVGVEHKGGDMFESIPEADAIFKKWILHDWDDEHCLKLLRNCYTALPEDGKIIIVEGIVL
ncbi:hypothetical protein ACH5RR_039547 [Cinchona calisaya]|uniref:O-methyltransferase C-terminal domain-containing protein n=1 Tax=Cinchona calisaya TaxID=153742 RepID=A0ABD2Y217_9GENT